MNKKIINSVIYAILLNIIVSMIFSHFATPEEIKPPNGAHMLTYKGQFMHMFSHHNQVLLISSLIVAIVVYMATSLAVKYPLYD